MKSITRNILFSLLLVLALALTGCGSSSTPTAAAAPTEAPAATQPAATEPAATEAPAAASADTSAVLMTITRADGTTFDVTLNAVKTLPLAKVTVDGKVEEGPRLSAVLALAGVTTFTEVSLSGSSSPATLTFEQVDKNTILDFNNHGTMKLATTYIPKADWTKDVSAIVVK